MLVSNSPIADATGSFDLNGSVARNGKVSTELFSLVVTISIDGDMEKVYYPGYGSNNTGTNKVVGRSGRRI